jgi:hypothetical protein
VNRDEANAFASQFDGTLPLGLGTFLDQSWRTRNHNVIEMLHLENMEPR